jgi:hypothetical protein
VEVNEQIHVINVGYVRLSQKNANYNEVPKSQEGHELKCSNYAEILLLNASQKFFIKSLEKWPVIFIVRGLFRSQRIADHSLH